MGFKRTSDGRVFFQGANEDSAAVAPKSTPIAEQKLQAMQSSGQSQMQILTLLKALNERLKTTQAERNYMRKQIDTYRDVIEGLEKKTEVSDRAVRRLEQKLSSLGTGDSAKSGATEAMIKETLKEMAETRKMILDIEDKAERAERMSSSLQKLQQDQAQKMARSTASYAQVVKRLQETEGRHDELSGQIEEAMTQQARLARKIEKTLDDRARFMRKIERIEETVIQTRDALNAKAMVLLTDQNAAIAADIEEEERTLGQMLLQAQEEEQVSAMPAPEAVKAVEPKAKSGFLATTIAKIQAVLVVLLLVLSAGAIWLAYQNKAEIFPENLFELTSGQNAATESTPEVQPTSTSQQAQSQQSAEEADWRIEEDTSAFSKPSAEPETIQGVPAESLAGLDDIGTISVENEQQLLELLGDNPDALAAALNNIEPGLEESLDLPEQKLASVDTDQTNAAAPASTTSAPAPAATTPAVQKKALDLTTYKPQDVAGSDQQDPNLPEAIKQVEEKAIAGSPEAQHDLAAVYTAGHAGVHQDYKRAAYWFRKAADQGVANAAYNLGVLYHQGLGLSPNMDEAIYWYDRAAQLGHPEAQYNLGIAYIEGIGVAYSPQKAGEYFAKAAQAGVIEAAYNLGLIYENGLMGKPEPEEALMWYKMAADKGSPEAKAALEQLAKALNITLSDVNRIVEDMKPKAPATPVKETAKVTKTVPTETETTQAQNTPAPVDEASPMESAEQEFEQILVQQIQEQLMRIGLYPGPADGVLGPLTRDAIRTFQAQQDLPVNGLTSDELLVNLVNTGGQKLN